MYSARHTDAANRSPKVSAGAAVRTAVQSCAAAGAAGPTVLVSVRLRSDLAMEHSATDGGVDQHEGQDEQPLTPEHERKAGMRRRGRGDRDRKWDHIGPE